jgi:hypothetical protein
VYQPRVQSDYQYPITGSSGSGTYENEALNGSRHIGATDYSQDNRTTADRCPQLPEGWTEHFDSVSKSYYYFHGVTQTTQWNIPEAPIQTYSESPMESTRSWQLLGGDPTGMRAGRNFEKSRAIDTSSDQLDGFSGLSLHEFVYNSLRRLSSRNTNAFQLGHFRGTKSTIGSKRASVAQRSRAA